jgi:hypothetical protein
MDKNPAQSAAKLFPQAASSNPAVFYGDNGKPRTLAQVYDFFSAKFQPASDDVQVASSANTADAPDAAAMTADDAAQQIMADDAQSANAMVALLSPSKPTRHPMTITRDAGTITWNGPRAIISPDTVRLAMLAQTNFPERNADGYNSAYGNGYGSVNS